jgi:hypothetical protein
VLIDFEDEETGEHTRILADPWLSDHATGDGMGRFPRLRFETRDLGPIHAVFLSHAHSDHLDPYTLVRLWRELAEPPLLLLPVTLSFLIPLFREHLRGCEVVVLEAHTPLELGTVELLGLFDIGSAPTNEDDVMVLLARNGSEAVLVEADANLTLDHPEFRAYVSELLAGPGVESAVFLTTENELTGTLASKDCPTLDARQELTAPHELDPRWQRILFPVTIEQRVVEERAAAARSGFRHAIDSLTVGCVHTITGGRVKARTPLPGLTLLDHDDQRQYDPDLEFLPALPCAPLRSDARDVDAQRARILALLDQRFLPYLHGARLPPVIHLLAAHGGAYRVRVHYGATMDDPCWDYVLSFGSRGFIEAPPHVEPQETYWANDLDDFLDGRCDEFSTFCRTQFPGQEIRLWACLATPLLNSDLVHARVRRHFERARDGLTPGSYVMSRYEVERP